MHRSASIRHFIIGMASCGALGLHGQSARLVLNDNAWVRIEDGAWLVIEDPGNTGIQTQGLGGNIRSEGEFNRIRWQIRNSTGSYTVPFTAANGVKIPFTYEAIGGGSNETQASICFSTYNYGALSGTNWDNDTYRPSDVTHMHNYYLGPPSNNSDQVVDRFWIVDPYAASAFTYSARPSIRLGFTYDPGAATGDVRTGNTITGASPVGAQRFNPGPQWWGDYWPSGTWAAGAVNTVTNVNVLPADFHRSWTLSSILQPLPVELLRFDAHCDAEQVVLTWIAASERDADHYRIERSPDGVQYESIGQLQATGLTDSPQHYAFVDPAPLQTGHYRLAMVGEDGSEETSPLRLATCNLNTTAIVNAWDAGDELILVLASPIEQSAVVSINDAAGRLVYESNIIALANGRNTISIGKRSMAVGVYLLSARVAGKNLVKRIAVY